MVKGLYTAYTGLVNQQKRLDVVSNNLANSTTTAYKKEGATSQSFDAMMAYKIRDLSVGGLDHGIGNVSLGVKVGETYRDYTQGSFKETGANFNFALASDGFFSISFTNKAGEESILYTRDGDFTMTKDGELVTKDGDYVLGQDGPIIVPTDMEISVLETGEIYAGGQYIDKLNIVDFEDYNYLEKYGENMFRTVDGATMKDTVPSVLQGHLEMSNVNVVSEMVQMITISRAFESNQKAMTAIDETLGQAVTLGNLS